MKELERVIALPVWMASSTSQPVAAQVLLFVLSSCRKCVVNQVCTYRHNALGCNQQAGYSTELIYSARILHYGTVGGGFG